VHEWERKGYTREDILSLLREFLPGVRVYDTKDPWYPARGGDPDRYIKGLLHSPGKVVGDATPEEVAALASATPRRPSAPLTMSFDQVKDELTEWLWPGYCAFKALTQMDGEKGQGKSFINACIIACATRGWAMPGQAEPVCGPIDVFIFAEDTKGELKKTLKAAGADLSRVHFPHPKWQQAITRQKQESERKRKRGAGQRESGEVSLLLPHGATFQMQMARETGSRLIIWDPITDYLDETISTNNDASVRRGIKPMAEELEEWSIAGWMIRHMNKDRKAAASLRGGGTTAFQNRARFHVVTGLIPAEYADQGKFGLSMVANNYVKMIEGTLPYDIVDSDLPLDNLGNMVGKAVWGAVIEELGADALTQGESARGRGPKPAKRETVQEELERMFDEKDPWAFTEAMGRLVEVFGDQLPTRKVIDGARGAVGIRSEQRRGLVGHWWTRAKIQVRRRG